MKLGDRVGLIVFGEIVASDNGGWLIHLDDRLNDEEVAKVIFCNQQIHVSKDYPMSVIPVSEEVKA